MLCQFKWSSHVNSNGAVCESFIRFSYVSKDHSAAAISDLVVKGQQKFDCLNKLIAQTYDGAAVMSDELNGVQAKERTCARCNFYSLLCTRA